MSGAHPIAVSTKPAMAGPRDRLALCDAILRTALIVNVLCATSSFHPSLLPPGLAAIQQYIGVLCWIVTIGTVLAFRPAAVQPLRTDSWAIILFYGYVVLSVLWTDMSAASLMKSAAMTVTSIGAFMLAKGRRLQSIIFDVNLGLLLLSSASIAVVLVAPDIGIGQGWLLDGKWQGVFESKQSLGVLGGLAMFFSAYLWLTRGASPLFAISFVCAAACAIGSESRGGGTLALLSCFCVFIAGRSRGVAQLLAFAPLAIMGIATLMISYLYITGHDSFLIGGERIDLTERTFIWQHALAHFDQRPLFGFGINGFWTERDIYGDYQRMHGWVLDDFHSGFVAILTETGVIGYAMFAICTLLFGIRITHAIQLGEMERSRIVALIGFLTLAYLINLTETIFLRSTSFIATLILVFAFNATLRFSDEAGR